MQFVAGDYNVDVNGSRESKVGRVRCRQAAACHKHVAHTLTQTHTHLINLPSHNAKHCQTSAQSWGGG